MSRRPRILVISFSPIHRDARVLREVVARFDQVAGPLEDHYGQVEQWEARILGRS